MVYALFRTRIMNLSILVFEGAGGWWIDRIVFLLREVGMWRCASEPYFRARFQGSGCRRRRFPLTLLVLVATGPHEHYF